MIMINGQDVIREAAAQASGVTWTLSDGTTVTGTDIAALDSFTLADVGRTVINGGVLVQSTADSFFNALLSVISRIEVDTRIYSGDLDDFMVKDSEWGGFIERIRYKLGDIITDPKWNLAANAAATPAKVDYSSEEHTFYQLEALAKVFQEAVPILTPISYPTDQLYEAVRNEAEMRAIIDGMRAAVRNTITLGIQSIRHMMAQAAIAISIANTGTAINLLAAYQTETGDTSVTVSNWQQSDAFQAFSMRKIAETRDNIRAFTTAFNDGTVPSFTNEEDSKLIVLNKFDKILRFGVKANTFHKENLALGDYSTTTSWQGFNAGGAATDFDFDSVSKIMIAADANNKLGIGTSAFTKTGVVALLFDRYALGISPYKRKVTSQFTAIADFYNEFHHTLIGTMIDTSYPIIAFYIDTP